MVQAPPKPPRCQNCGMFINSVLQEWGGDCPRDPKGHYVDPDDRLRYPGVQDRMKELQKYGSNT